MPSAKQPSPLKRAFAEDGPNKTHIGGQALIEGIMMRGKGNWAVAVRQPNGTLHTEQHPLSKKGQRSHVADWPLIRGCIALVDSFVLGYKALSIAANYAIVEEDEAGEEESFGAVAMGISLVLGIVLGVALFVLAPAAVANLAVGNYNTNTLAWNLVDGFGRVAIFIFYVWLIGRMSDIKRMFAYHGAEHKTIHCYEHGLELTPENAANFPRLHVRCGTAFLIMVMIIAIIVYTLVPLDGLIASMGVTSGAAIFALVVTARIILLPLIAGISYEINVKWAGSHPEHPLVKVVLWPGLQMQYLTTNEPDESQLEAAIAAMKLVVEYEAGHNVSAEEGQPPLNLPMF